MFNPFKDQFLFTISASIKELFKKKRNIDEHTLDKMVINVNIYQYDTLIYLSFINIPRYYYI